MEIDLVQAELERLFDLDELTALSRELLGFDPDAIGGTTALGSFARALTEHCVAHDAVEALCDAVVGSKRGANPELAHLGFKGLLPHDDLPTPGRFGPFELVRKLGAGPAGIAYLAKTEEGRDVRLKVLRQEAVRDVRALRRFLTLTRLAARIGHAALPERLMTGSVEGRHYVAEDAVVGESLAERVARSGPLLIDDVRDHLRLILDGLGALHAERFVHGNLKLENVLVGDAPDGRPRTVLVDACGDRLRARAPANGHVEPWSLTSPKTASPEQLRGNPATLASDLYSFGAMVFELVTGQAPFATRTVADAIVAHLSEAPRAPSTVAPRGFVAKDVDDFVLSLLEKDPAQRPSSIAVVRERLDSLGKGDAEMAFRPAIDEAALAARIERVLASPDDDDAALSLDSAVSEGADANRVAEAFLEAATRLDTDDESTHSHVKGLLFRAGRLFERAANRPEDAENAYAAIAALDPSDGAAAARLDEVRKKLGKYDELVESMLERAERAETTTERASLLSQIGHLYETVLSDAEQALVALTQAFCADPVTARYSDDIERLAGSDAAAWTEVLSQASDATSHDVPDAIKNALFIKLGDWYDTKQARPDLALSCFQAVLATDPSNDQALDALATLYRKSQQWSELGALLLTRGRGAMNPAKGRELLAEAAMLLEQQLGNPGAARDLYTEILAVDPTHVRAGQMLSRLYEQSGDHASAARLLETQASIARGEERVKLLSKLAELHEDHLGDDQASIRKYQDVLGEDAGHLDALRGLDRLYSKSGRFHDLLVNLEQQLRFATTPRQKVALWERIAGVYDEEFLDHEKAAHALEHVVELDPQHDDALTSLSRHYRASNRWEDLISIYDRQLLLVADPARRLDVALAKARALEDPIGSTERAIGAYEDVRSLAPDHGGALEALARLRQTAGHEDAALAAVEALAEQADTGEAKAEHLQRAARLLETRGDTDGAIERYKRALDASPRNGAIAVALRSAYLGRGDVPAAVDLLERELSQAEGDLAKVKLSSELATLYLRMKDDDKADRAARRALELDPTDTEALRVVGDLAYASGRYLEATATYERLASRADSLTPQMAARVLERYVDAAARSGSTEKALAAVDSLLRIAPHDAAAFGRAAHVTFEHGAPARAHQLYRDYIERFSDGLLPDERFLAAYRAGEAARRAGELDAAVAALETAAELDPSNPLPLIALATTHETRGQWARVLEAKTRHLDIAEGDDRLRLLVEIGDVAAGKLDDRTLATKSLVAALEERPDDRKLLARLMQLYSEDKDWQKLLDVVLKLADFVDDPKQKAKYLLTAAMVAGGEMRDYDQALDFYDRVRELDPTNTKAEDEPIELLEQKGDYQAAVERLKEKAKNASAAQDTTRMLEAFNKLWPIYRDKLGRIGHAVDALEAAQTLEPENEERNQLLAEMYGKYPEKFMDKAIAAQMAMLRQNPYRVESYKLLRRIYTDDKRADAAWCLCQALYVLKLAEPDEERFFRRMRAEDPAYAQAIMTGDDWLEFLFHPDADPMLTSLFALIEPAIVATRGENLQRMGYDPAYAIDPSAHPFPVTQTLHYAAGVIGVPLPPIFENPNDPAGLGFLHAQPPCMVLGSAALAAQASPQAMAFVAGRHLAYFKPGFYARQLVQSGTGLRSWLFAAIQSNAPKFPIAPDIEGPVREAALALDRHLAPQLRDHLARVVSKLIQSGAALDLKKWVQGIDLTADRIGFVLSHDLETSVEIVRASDDSSSALMPQARLKDLVLYSISPQYFRLRERLGITIGG
jgi:tetratricopeptide (TPR) repeat protein